MEELKIGDWVRDTRSGIKRPVFQLQPNCIALTNPEEYGKQYIKWIPEPGELCWFMFSKHDRPFIDKFSHIEKEFILGSTIIKPAYHTIGGTLAKAFCEPFIGELPTFLKDL